MLCICNPSKAGDSTETVRSFELFEWGLSFGFGFVNEDIPEGNYGPFMFGAHIEFRAGRKQRDPASPHFFLLFLEPQLNPVLVGGGIDAWEIGGNIGAKYPLVLRERNAMFFHAGSGPMYLSLKASEHQAGGINFASNFGLG